MGQYHEYALKRVGEFEDQLMMKGRARTKIGMAQTTAMVGTAAHNLEILTGGEDSFQTAIKAFSKRGGADKVKQFANGEVTMPAFESVGEGGLSSVQNLQTVSAIDITIQMLIYSFLPWIAIERPMNDSTTTISWREVIATNNAAGVNKGDTLIGNFKVENSAMDLSTPIKTLTANGAGEVLVIDFGAQLYEGTVLMTLTDNSGSEPVTVTGKDYNGVVAFPGYTTAFNVDYENGTLTSAAAVSAGFSVAGQAMIDMWADKAAPNVLRSTSKMRSVQMVSRESGIIMEDSVDRMMFILKTLDQSGGAMSLEQYMSQMMFDLYVAYVNNLLMIGIHTRSAQLEGTDELAELTVDLSSYGSQIIADPSRKYDELNTLTNMADAQMLRTVNKGVTVWVVGSKICTLMASDKYRFKKSDTYNVQMNTLAGVYDGKPVLRHQYIDKYIDMADNGFGNGFGVHRDPNGEVGFMAYGEYLPIHTTDNVYNYANPLQFAKALVAQIGTKIIEPGLCVRFRFKVVESL